MNLYDRSRSARTWSNKKIQQYKFPVIIFFILTLVLVFLVYFSYYSLTPNSLLSFSSSTSRSSFTRCSPHPVILGERFLWYAPNSGFINQLSEFKNAILMAGILNRTLIVPPVLDHHAVVLGSCPKFRVSAPNEIRVSVWDHVMELMRDRMYVSMSDIVDISPLVYSSLLRVIDFRDFVSLWCGVNVDFGCFDESKVESSVLESLKQCGHFLSGLHGNLGKCLYAVEDDCRTTIWTYQNDDDGVLDSFQPDEQLKKKKISFVKRRKEIVSTLGPGTEAGTASLLSFGSLFTSPYKGSELYIDFHKTNKDQRFNLLMDKTKLIPFVPEILSAGKEFTVSTIKAPYLCAQLRLLDGQFKNHWKATFLGLKQKLESLVQEAPHPVRVFLMTDLPRGNWTGTYLEVLAKDSHRYKLYWLDMEDKLVRDTAEALVTGNDGWRSKFLPCTHDVLLHIVCSCATLGFVGTAGSTIAESVELMRRYGVWYMFRSKSNIKVTVSYAIMKGTVFCLALIFVLLIFSKY